MRRALIIVDVQNDFLPKGSLAVPEGQAIIPVINQLCGCPFALIVATKDWHPVDHVSFAETHGGQPGDHVQVEGVDQILWPAHCVQETKGAEFSPLFDASKVDHICYKGVNSRIDSYSTFFDNAHLRSTGLGDYLTEAGITEVYFAGLATDYCVKYSVLDALHLGFKAYVIVDACRGVNLRSGDVENALQSMKDAGAVLVSSQEILNKSC